MVESALQALEAAFPEVVAHMPEFFDSHDFVLKLAHAQQQLYVAALAAVDSEHPFQIVHREISRRLLTHPELVSRIGERSSRDIFGQKSSATVWNKVERRQKRSNPRKR
jgi:hypothetical protein